MKNQESRTIVIFGASDNEEKAARRIAILMDCAIGTATFKGKPVHAGNAYLADGYRIDRGDENLIQQAIIFECTPNCAGSMLIAGICDHHNPGDFGYELPPAQYWRASSLGQLVDYLNLSHELPYENEEMRYVAAADHCPADAYAGRCPGIEPKQFEQFRIAQIAQFEYDRLGQEQQDNTTVFGIKNALGEVILDAERVLISSNKFMGMPYISEEIDHLPEAALKTGQSYIAKIPERGRDRELTGNGKIVIGGHTTPKQVEEFMAWAATLSNRIGEPYGNPARGYAGVVVGPALTSCPTCGEVWACANINTCPACGIQYPEEG